MTSQTRATVEPTLIFSDGLEERAMVGFGTVEKGKAAVLWKMNENGNLYGCGKLTDYSEIVAMALRY